MSNLKNAIIIDASSLNSDLDFRLDFTKFYDLLLTLTDSTNDSTKIFYFDHEDSAKHTFHYSMEHKGYILKLKPADFQFVNPKYIQCHCCETLVLDPNTNKNIFNLNLGTEISHFVHTNLNNYDKFTFVTSNGDFVILAKYLTESEKIGKVILPNSKVAGEFMMKNLDIKNVLKLEKYYSDLGGEIIERKIIEKQKPTALAKFGKRK
jgi:NYN domain